jgi:hypothetical protein
MSATVGVATKVNATEAMRTELVFSPSSVRTIGSDRITKANSDACAIRKPSWIDPGVDHLKIRLAAMLEAILPTMISAATSRIAGPHAMIVPGSMDRPTETKKKPSSSPRNGLISDWITAR